MASLDGFRVFVAVYRTGSVSGAARERHLTQPAVSAQLAALEARVGEPLFTRTPRGVVPTERGKLLYAQVADSVDRLALADQGLRRPGRSVLTPLRLGMTPEVLHGLALPRVARLDRALHVTFGPDRDVLAALGAGTLDAALVTTAPEGRHLSAQEVAPVPYALIGPAGWRADVPDTLADLAAWLNARSWVSYSVELPITRRFFTGVLGARFAARQALVAPDLRAVVRAVALGLGASVVPAYAAQEALDAAQVAELWPVHALIPAARWSVVVRTADEERADLLALVAALKR
ncbi:DNA-binding transcriptional LysR family regulator [Deinococcus metalli]|uniref:DNA-binding transcriptional LysR family regulator n=1 Tax=Deinococcus metalli TaxID=1141878 RepID=A0A7W8KEM3_9DEIO|nr:LysR family transcriptional regulator [Deinococcus metalli]MBB5376348.1 DNA-binding transcriptional LysR family regulator [Deinococcus metalli]GHF38957.1 hypothetical protein GCM10017781_14330 [Deinococcus metalli]